MRMSEVYLVYVYTVADPGFVRWDGGSDNLIGGKGVNLLFGQIFHVNCMKRNWTEREACPLGFAIGTVVQPQWWIMNFQNWKRQAQRLKANIVLGMFSP